MLTITDKVMPISGKAAQKESGASVERTRMTEWLEGRIAAAKKEPQSEIVTITPILAKLLLERNDDNRPISQIGIERLRRDMEAGRFEFNGQPIVVSKEGLLNDGQHRITAIIESGRSLRCPVIFGADRKSRFTLDQGIPRSVGNFLAMHNYRNTAALAALAANVWQYLERNQLSTNGRDKPTKSEALMTVSHFKDLPDALSLVSRSGSTVVASNSLLAFSYWAIARVVGSAAAQEFIEKLITGADLKQGDPILYCRKRLLALKGAAGFRGVNEKAEIIFRAWNFYRRGEHVKTIPIMDGPLPKLEK